MAFRLNWLIEREVLLRDFLKENQISKAALTDIKFKGGKILVNQSEVTVRYILKEGDHLSVIFPPELPSEGLLAERLPLEILYEDEYLLVVQKNSQMSTIPSREHPTGSLANALIGYYQEEGIDATTHIVTRLDRDTSGLVLIAKHRHIHHLLSEQQKRHKIKRTYLAFAEGNLKQNSGTIDAPIGRCEDSIIKREVRHNGQKAITHYKVLNRNDKFTIVELALETGRTHQIRVHLSHIGHPLVGDDLYGGERELLNRQALHCKDILFSHPITGEKMVFSAQLPDDMGSLTIREE